MGVRVFLFVLALLPIAGFGQKKEKLKSLTVYVRPKISYFQCEEPQLREDRSALLKSDLGARLTFSPQRLIAFSLGLELANNGWKDNFAEETVKRNYMYLRLPVECMVRLYQFDRLNFKVFTGLTHDFLARYTKKINGEKTKSESDRIGSIQNMTWRVGLRSEYKLNDPFSVMASFCYSKQLIYHHSWLMYDYGLSLGAVYTFGKKASE